MSFKMIFEKGIMRLFVPCKTIHDFLFKEKISQGVLSGQDPAERDMHDLTGIIVHKQFLQAEIRQ